MKLMKLRGPRELNIDERTDRFYRGGFSRLRGPRDRVRRPWVPLYYELEEVEIG